MREGRLRWPAPAGRWHVMVVTEDRLYEGTHADGNLHEKMPYVNLLHARADGTIHRADPPALRASGWATTWADTSSPRSPTSRR